MRSGRSARLLRAGFEHRLFPFALGLVVVALMLPSIGGGLFQDDLVHRAHLLKERVVPARYYGTPLLCADAGTLTGAMRDTFGVARSREDVSCLRDSGPFPWWTSDNLRVSNWRPVTALTHWLDYRLFPDSPALRHAHNFLWFGAVIAPQSVFVCRDAASEELRRQTHTGVDAGACPRLAATGGHAYGRAHARDPVDGGQPAVRR
jgi:hypothetical protein